MGKCSTTVLRIEFDLRDPDVTTDTAVVEVDLPGLPDEVDYEGLLSRLPMRARGKVVLLATPAGFKYVRSLVDGQQILLPGMFQAALRDLARQRLVAAFGWRDD